MNNTLIKQTFPIIVVISILSGVYWLNKSEPIDLGANQCYLQDSECHIALQEHTIELAFEHFPIQIEEMSAFTVTHDKQLQFQDGWVEGTNMFMGRSQVLEQQVSSTTQMRENQLALFLGACSEPSMRWRLVLNFKDLKTDKTLSANVYFQTSLE